jgi:hypothetical protein
MMFAHLHQASPAIFAVNQAEKRPHDQTPSFDPRRQCSLMIISVRLHGSSEMVSSAEKIVSSGSFEEISSRVREE